MTLQDCYKPCINQQTTYRCRDEDHLFITRPDLLCKCLRWELKASDRCMPACLPAQKRRLGSKKNQKKTQAPSFKKRPGAGVKNHTSFLQKGGAARGALGNIMILPAQTAQGGPSGHHRQQHLQRARPPRVRPQDEHALARRRPQRLPGVQRRGGSGPPAAPSSGPSGGDASLRNFAELWRKIAPNSAIKTQAVNGTSSPFGCKPSFFNCCY